MTASGNPPTNPTKFDTPTCVCQHPYAGQYCEYTIRECSDNPCTNGGVCVPATCAPTNTAHETVAYDCFRCACPANWGGSKFFTSGEYNNPARIWNAGGICDTPRIHNDCTTGKKCENGGTCGNVATIEKDTYACACGPEWLGGTERNCTSPLFNCDTSAPNAVGCLNGGTCNNGVRQPCSCPQFYGGFQCEVQPWCNTNTCQNGGTCVNDGPGTGHCSCGANNAGDYCEQTKFCAVSPCQNGGTCNPGSGAAGTCSCTNTGFSGQFCNTTNFCTSNPCQNGATCNNINTLKGGEGTCTCPDRYWGPRCEKSTSYLTKRGGAGEGALSSSGYGTHRLCCVLRSA